MAKARKKLSKKAAIKKKEKEMGQRPDIEPGTEILLELERKVRYASSGTGTAKVTQKKVKVRRPVRKWDYTVEDAQGRIYSLTFRQGEPVSMSGDKADYHVISSDFRIENPTPASTSDLVRRLKF